jgi:hypothetical protein
VACARINGLDFRTGYFPHASKVRHPKVRVRARSTKRTSWRVGFRSASDPQRTFPH